MTCNNFRFAETFVESHELSEKTCSADFPGVGPNEDLQQTY